MFDINKYPEILDHVRSISKICRPNTSGWIECFCPYCDDATRKINPQNGHFHLSPVFPVAHCFRCGIKVSLVKYLKDTDFNNEKIIRELSGFSFFTYGNINKIISEKKIDIFEIVKNQYDDFIKNHYNEFLYFRKYIYKRCYDINPINFFLIPRLNNGNLQCVFFNYLGEISTIRNISNSSISRYVVLGDKKYYYFQNIYEITNYTSITICEGGFDAINLYNYNPLFKDNYFIAIGGINYQKLITEIICNHLLIGGYIINIVFDKNVKNLNNKIRKISNLINILNPNITLNCFIPSISKDVSDFMHLFKIY